MTAKEFFEQNRGNYFKYYDDVVRVVGYNDYSILTAGKKGWDYYKNKEQGIRYIDESLINEDDKLWFAHIECLITIDKPELDLCKLLEGCEGMTFYSSIHGNVILKLIRDSGNDTIVVTLSDDDTIDYCKDGRYLSMYDGECMLFPSKENRDWSTFVKPNKIKEGTPVLTKWNSAAFWKLESYTKDNKSDFIVPVSEFDFTDFDSNKSKSII